LTQPLAGRSVVVTRARAQASGLANRLAGLGAAVVELPVIAIGDPSDGGAALSVAAHRLAAGAYQWVAVTSFNGASRLLAALGDRTVPDTVRWAAVGTATAASLRAGGYPPTLVPGVSVAEALAEAFPVVDPLHPGSSDHAEGPGTVLFPRAESVRPALAPGLRAKGWLVDEVVAYRTEAGDPGPEAVSAARRADAIAFTSSSTVQRTVELLTSSGVPSVVASIGPITSDAVRAAGLAVAVEAKPHTIDALVEALVSVLGGSGGAGRRVRTGQAHQRRPGPQQQQQGQPQEGPQQQQQQQ
jgi:uroporphyrinogen-III synthase